MSSSKAQSEGCAFDFNYLSTYSRKGDIKKHDERKRLHMNSRLPKKMGLANGLLINAIFGLVGRKFDNKPDPTQKDTLDWVWAIDEEEIPRMQQLVPVIQGWVKLFDVKQLETRVDIGRWSDIETPDTLCLRVTIHLEPAKL